MKEFKYKYMFFERVKGVWLGYPVFIVLILFTFLAAAISRCDILDPIKFVFVQLTFIFMPGYALHRLLGLSYQNSLVRGLISYASGYSLSIIVYLVLLMAGIQQYTMYVYLVICLFSVGYLFLSRKRVPDAEIKQKERLCFAYILLTALCVSMVLFQFVNINPSLKQGNTWIDQDLVFWLRNAVAATKEYPLPELSVMGKVFFYHYFTSIEIAFLHFVTGIELYDLCFTYSYLITIFLITSGFYVLAKALVKNSKYVFVVLAFMLFTANFETLTHISFSQHLFMSSFGFAEGLAFFCFTFYCYIRLLHNDDCRWKLLLLAILLFFVTTGLKGPVAAVLLAGIAVGSVFLLFRKGMFVFGVVSGMSFLVVFLVALGVFVLNVNSQVVEGGTSELTLSLTDTLFHNPFFEKLYFSLCHIGLWNGVSYIIVLQLFLILGLFIPLLLIMTAFTHNIPDDTSVILLVMSGVGLVLGLFVSQNGLSQMYFLFMTIVCLLYWSFTMIPTGELKKSVERRFLLIFMIGFLFFSSQYYYYGKSGIFSLCESMPMAKDILKLYTPQNDETGLTISGKEMDGLRWCRENLPEDAVLLSNKVFAEIGARSFWVSSLSERQTFFESYHYSNVSNRQIQKNLDLVSSFYEGCGKSCLELKKRGCKYAVIFKRIKPNHYPENCIMMYDSPELSVVSF